MLLSSARTTLSAVVLAGLSLTGASSAWAVAVTPQSYDLSNGDGQAHGGTFNYWDKAYTGSGDTSSDRSALSGGHGDLTDGVIATQNWFEVENNEGTGPYVGWRDTDTTIVFHFGHNVQIGSITLHADDADGNGGVFAPGGITVGGNTYNFADPAGSAPNTFTVDNLHLSGSDVSITVHRRVADSWVFVSEVSFAAAVPEPGEWALAFAGLATVAGWRRRGKARRARQLKATA